MTHMPHEDAVPVRLERATLPVVLAVSVLMLIAGAVATGSWWVGTTLTRIGNRITILEKTIRTRTADRFSRRDMIDWCYRFERENRTLKIRCPYYRKGDEKPEERNR